MINVSFSNEEITVKRMSQTPLKWKIIEGVDGESYQAKVPGSVKTNVDFTSTHKEVLIKTEMPEQIKSEFSESELELILEKQKKAIQKNLDRNIPACIKQIDFLLKYKDFIEGGAEVEILAGKIKELQGVLKKK